MTRKEPRPDSPKPPRLVFRGRGSSALAREGGPAPRFWYCCPTPRFRVHRPRGPHRGRAPTRSPCPVASGPHTFRAETAVHAVLLAQAAALQVGAGVHAGRAALQVNHVAGAALGWKDKGRPLSGHTRPGQGSAAGSRAGRPPDGIPLGPQGHPPPRPCRPPHGPYGRTRRSSSCRAGRRHGSTGGRTRPGCCRRRRGRRGSGSGPACRPARTAAAAPAPRSPRRPRPPTAPRTRRAADTRGSVRPTPPLPQQSPAPAPAVTHVLGAGLGVRLLHGVVAHHLGLVDLLQVPEVDGAEEHAWGHGPSAGGARSLPTRRPRRPRGGPHRQTGTRSRSAGRCSPRRGRMCGSGTCRPTPAVGGRGAGEGPGAGRTTGHGGG